MAPPLSRHESAIQDAVQAVRKGLLEERPRNTSLAYENKQQLLPGDNPQAEMLPVGVPVAQEDRAVSPTPMHTPAPATPQYTLNRQLATVKAVWREFSTGLPGQPSVRHLENTYKSKWRVGEAENRFFRKRKELYRAVACIATARHILPLRAAKLLDEYAEAEDLTLDQLRIQITTATERLCLPTEKSE